MLWGLPVRPVLPEGSLAKPRRGRRPRCQLVDDSRSNTGSLLSFDSALGPAVGHLVTKRDLVSCEMNRQSSAPAADGRVYRGTRIIHDGSDAQSNFQQVCRTQLCALSCHISVLLTHFRIFSLSLLTNYAPFPQRFRCQTSFWL